MLDKFTSACDNCRGKCQRILRKSIITSAKKLPVLVLQGTQILNFNPMIFQLENFSLVENTVKHIHFQDHRQKIKALLAVTYNLVIFNIYTYFCLLESLVKNLIKFNITTVKQSSFIHLNIALM